LKEPRGSHRAFLNRYYGISRHFYDPTRKYYLFGRDTVLDQVLQEPWTSLVEVGVGTGRNLRLLHARRPEAAYGGIDASDEMLVSARKQCPFAKLAHGFAEDAPIRDLLGRAPDRILMSYLVSIVTDPAAALDNARRSVAPGGEVVVVDFCDLHGLARPYRVALLRWLRAFHVSPIDLALLPPEAKVTIGPLRYYFIARLPAL
jgi:S-adenosylmethionine-diacylgycerolhomoserine-N-methlytransferase